MKRLFLASSIETTGPAIGKEISDNPGKLKLAFINTAAEPEGGDLEWMHKDREGLKKAGFDITDYTITKKTVKDFDRELEAADVIHVNGGNTFYFLLQARKSGFDKWIKEIVFAGKKIYTGSSAGSIACAPNTMNSGFFENYTYDKELKTYEGLNLVDFLVFPHWGSEDFRDKYMDRRMEIAYEPRNKLILLNDWQYVKVEGDNFKIIDIRDKY